MDQFEKLLKLFRQKLELEVEDIKKREPENLYHPVIYTLNMGGKRLRPVLLLLAYGLYSSDMQKALDAALAIEAFHNFTLLHDDIMDDADIRRNKNTVHIEYSKNTAILSGDAMSIMSYEYLAKCGDTNFRNIFELFTQTALQICEGQQYDMDFETNNKVSVDQYLHMIQLKTAVLLGCSLKIGALLADAPKKEADILYQFGINMGMAFQLQDDLLDSFGDTRNFGKEIGGDIVSNKKTYLLLKALELADDQNKEILLTWIEKEKFEKKEKIDRVLSVFKELKIDDITRKKMWEYHEQSVKLLAGLNVAGKNKDVLVEIANSLLKRVN